MTKKLKWRNRLFWIRILIMILVLAGSYCAYAFIYRGRNEPPAKRKVTNQEAAYYTLRGQIQMLSQKEELMAFAFDDRTKEREYGTYIIPGLKSTRTLLTSEGDMPAMCTTMTPQGLAVTEDYVFVSAYCHAKKHNSVIYMIDKESHRFIKEIVLPGQPHVGDTCDGSTLRKVQIPYILIEILAGCCLHTVSACTKVDGIQVILKDYIFIIDLLLNLNGKVLLLKLTRKSFNLGGLVGPVGEDIVLQKLLGNGTCTL